MALRRIPSRHMHLQPSGQASMTWQAWLLIAAIIAALLTLLGTILSMLAQVAGWMVVLAGVGLIVTYVGCRILDERDRIRRMAAVRERESICTFVRQFDCRAFDTWVLRATYEKISEYVGLPLRPTDRLVEDLSIDPEDLDDLADEIALAAGRSLDDTAENPWRGQVATVADMCDFMMCQPRRAASA